MKSKGKHRKRGNGTGNAGIAQETHRKHIRTTKDEHNKIARTTE